MPIDYLPANVGVTFSKAYAEAIASAKMGDPVLITLEMRHPDFRDEDGNPTSARVVADYRNLTATDENGQTHTYIGVPFRHVKGDQSDSGAPRTATVEIDNVTRQIVQALMQARGSDEPVEVVVREYLPSDTSAPHVLPVSVYELSAPIATVETVQAQLGYGNLTNMKWPARVYTVEEFPGLQPW
jgi:Domain of unknown function (DUF1833)